MKKIFKLFSFNLLFLFAHSISIMAQGEDEFLAFTGVGGQVTIPNHSAFNITTGNFSVEAWVKMPTDAPAVSLIMSKRTSANFYNNGFVFGFLNGKLYVRLVDANIEASAIDYRDNKFHHVAAVRNGGKMYFYVDGSLISNPLGMAAPQNISNTANLLLGNDGSNLFHYKGYLDDVRFWNKALTATEIGTNKCGIANPAAQTNLMGYWKFDDVVNNGGTATNTIRDVAGTAASTTNPLNNGTLDNSGLLTVLRHARYQWLPMFDANTEITVEEVEFEQFKNSDVWQGGNSSCFLADNYSTPITGTDTRRMKFVIARPNAVFDGKGECTSRAAIVYVHGAGYADGAVNASINDPNTVNGLKLWAARGYVAVAINYRKGWDIGGISTTFFNTPNPITCTPSPTTNNPYTFMQATYRMAQDVKAAHAKLLATPAWKVDANKVFYSGVSTGACAALHAAYAADDMPNYGSPTLASTTGGDMNALVLPSIKSSTSWAGIQANLQKVAGILGVAGAIKSDTWVGNNTNDKIPAILLHGTCDVLVPFCDGKLCNMNFSNNVTSGSNLNHLEMQGSGQIFDVIKNNTSSPKLKSILFDFEGLGHFFGAVLGGINVNLNGVQLDMPIYQDMMGVLSFYTIINYPNGLYNGHVKISPTGSNQYTAGAATLLSSGCGNGTDPCLMDAFYSQKTSSGISNDQITTFSLRPNPTSDNLNINYNSIANETAEIMLYDLKGKLVLQTTEIANEGDNEYNLTLGELPTGLYIIQLQTPTQRLTRKVQVIK